MKHILIIDDDRINLDCARKSLTRQYKITATISGRQALQFLETNSPDLILLDLNMPFMDGYEVMGEIKANPRIADIPVVFLSAEKDAVTEARCLELGAVDFLPKPFVPSILLSRIEKVFRSLDQKRELKKELDQIKDKSQRDALTGLWNRAYAAKNVEERIKNGGQGALFMLDMDNFKAINDNYGHDAGDNTLKMFADTLRTYSKDRDIPARVGGDEFVTWIDGYVDKETLSRRAGAIISDLCKKLEDCRFETNSSVSLGIAIYPADGESFTDLYNSADKALYYVKQNGKNSYHFYSDEMVRNDTAGALSIDYVHEAMRRADGKKGAYMLDYHGFTYVYNFLSRLSERNEFMSRMLLITLDPAEGYTPGDAEISRVSDVLDQALVSSLRRGDVAANYTTRQVLVMLPGTGEPDALMIAERIRHEYESRLPGCRISLQISHRTVAE